MDKIQKDVDALKRIAEALIDRMEALERAAGIEKDTAGIKVQKAATTNAWKPNLDFGSALEKSRNPQEPESVEGPIAAVSRKHRSE